MAPEYYGYRAISHSDAHFIGSKYAILCRSCTLCPSSIIEGQEGFPMAIPRVPETQYGIIDDCLGASCSGSAWPMTNL
jgi:hypothetical protein